MKKVVYISGTRADFGLMKKTLQLLAKRVDLTVVATSMHLNKKYGDTVKEIESSGLRVKKAVTLVDSNNLEAMATTLSNQISIFTKIMGEILPDVIFVEGDRSEGLAGAIIGAYLNIPVIHHGGGDMSGSIDDKVRNAVTVFSNYHLTTNLRSYKELASRRVSPKSIFNVGEPGLDDIREGNFTVEEEVLRKYHIDISKGLILLVFHPNTEEQEEAGKQIKEILEALSEIKLQIIAVRANADAGGIEINGVLEEYAKKDNNLTVYPHITRRDFLGLMNVCTCMVGNSSSGIIEMPSFKKPFVSVGSRQKNRLEAGNVISVGCNKDDIVRAVNKTLRDGRFLKKLETIKNPYGDGKSSSLMVGVILKILEDVNENNK